MCKMMLTKYLVRNITSTKYVGAMRETMHARATPKPGSVFIVLIVYFGRCKRKAARTIKSGPRKYRFGRERVAQSY